MHVANSRQSSIACSSLPFKCFWSNHPSWYSGSTNDTEDGDTVGKRVVLKLADKVKTDSAGKKDILPYLMKVIYKLHRLEP